MQALAKGGFQVEELARLQYPEGIFIDTENYEYEKAVQLTNEALKNENPLDAKMNELIQTYVKALNTRKNETDHDRWSVAEDVFQVPTRLLQDLITPFAEWIRFEQPVPVFFPSGGRGIYGGEVNYDDMMMAWHVKLVPIIKANNIFQGTDKIGHFIGQGWQ